MKDTTKHCIINGIIVLFGVLSIAMISITSNAENVIRPPKIEKEATTEEQREEIVTGMIDRHFIEKRDAEYEKELERRVEYFLEQESNR